MTGARQDQIEEAVNRRIAAVPNSVPLLPQDRARWRDEAAFHACFLVPNGSLIFDTGDVAAVELLVKAAIYGPLDIPFVPLTAAVDRLAAKIGEPS